MMWNRLGALAIVLLVSGWTVRANAQSDQIVLVRGPAVSGIISNTTPNEVTVSVRGSERTIQVNEIRRINFADEPTELRRAREDILTGQIENGLSVLRQLNPGDVQRDLVRQDLQFYVAYCMAKLALSGGGDKAQAATALLDFVRQAPQSFHFYEAAELLGHLAVALESYDNAMKYYGALERAPWPEYQMRGLLLEARALMAQDKFAEASEKYDRVLAFGVDTPEATRQKLLAQVGKAACSAETGQAEQAVSVLEKIIADHDPQDTELFGRVYNALGRAYRKLGKTKDALLAYLHVDLLFYSDPDIHAEALYYLSRLWGQINRSDRAVAARNLLLERYGGSVWAKRE